MIKRGNGSLVYSSNIPIAIIKDLGWTKGDILEICITDGKLVIIKSEVQNG